MYGKNFASMYEGSMVGAGADVFSVWPYIITHQRVGRDGVSHVELNPVLMGLVLGIPVDRVMEALAYLEAEDPNSRTPGDEGRRIVCESAHRHAGPMQYRVVNGRPYRDLRSADDRREYNRMQQAKSRARKKAKADGVEFDADAWDQQWDADGADKVLGAQRPMKRGYR